MQSSMHLTHVVFSPNGEELLLSYSGEHVYLMDANCGITNNHHFYYQFKFYFLFAN